MSLSFREQAAIALKAAWDSNPDNGVTGSVDDAVNMAAHLAEACCEKWGHDARTTITDDRRAVPLCQRCGKVVKP